MLEKSKQLESQMRGIQNKLKKMPEGKLICSHTGPYCKWERSDGHKKTYIPKKDRELAEKFKFFEKKQAQKVLKITIPENLNYQGAFDEILKKYTKKYSLTRIKTTDLGSLFELNYSVIMLHDEDEQEFINELRCRNGNLNIILAVSAPIKIK